ncbi:MAG: serine protease AprX [Frankiaceae bacterium]|nr:serine protease AprX [Frankiaceae bacterium]
MRHRNGRTRGLTLGLGLAAVLTAAPSLATAPSPSAATTEPSYRAVVALSSSTTALPGVRVLARYGHVDAAVVTGTRSALQHLAGVPGVRGVSPDVALSTASDNHGNGRSVFAWEGLGSSAGKPRAGAGVTVALLDTGVSDSAALDRASGRLVDGVDTSALAEGGEARTTGRFTDGYGHGTFMATLIAGGPVDGTGKRGLGVAPMARVVVVKVADRQGVTSLSEVLAGLDWVAVQSPKIQLVNIALAHPKPGAHYGEDPLTVAVEHVQAAGVAVVAAVGNTPGEVGDPGLDPRVLTVGAADLASKGGKHDVDVADFSGYGSVAGVRKPDLVASGVGLLGILPANSTIARANPASKQRDGLWRGSGTSESTAIATGVAAEFLSSHPDATLNQVKPSLRSAADPIGQSRRSGQGLLNVADAAVASTPSTTGEGSLDAAAFADNAWRHGDWRDLLDSAWSDTAQASSWSASSWSSQAWQSSSWTASSWSASSWSASSWSGSSWSGSSWSASSWSGSSWSGSSWSGSSWSAGSWSAGSWSAAEWGDDE